MNKKFTKKMRRRLCLITLLTVSLSLAFSFNAYRMLKQVVEIDRETKSLESKMDSLKDEEAYLKVEVEKFNDPDYVARYAREKYLYSKDGEFTIKMP